MSVDYFLDTNIFSYDIEATDKRKQRIAQQLITHAIESDTGVISYQVVQECLNVITHKAHRPLTAVEAERYLDAVLAPLCHLFPSLSFYRRALAVKERWRFGFYDSLIITAALEAGCRTLYTEDLQHDQKINGLRIVDPFR
jgi:predicted nucleic acid-binding protein